MKLTEEQKKIPSDKRHPARVYSAPRVFRYGKVSELTKTEYRYLMGNNGSVSGA